MVESRDRYESMSEVEAMVRSAGGYVQPSKDLRPRVLETARLQIGERQVRRRIRHVALFAAVVGWFTISSVDRMEIPDSFRELTLVAAVSPTFSGAKATAGGGDSGWALVDAYTEVRRRQAEVLRMTL